jgi:hypothetical protein
VGGPFSGCRVRYRPAHAAITITLPMHHARWFHRCNAF